MQHPPLLREENKCIISKGSLPSAVLFVRTDDARERIVDDHVHDDQDPCVFFPSILHKCCAANFERLGEERRVDVMLSASSFDSSFSRLGSPRTEFTPPA